jgi:hypothetical protein
LVKLKPRPGSVIVSADGDGVLSHAGTALLVETADRAHLVGLRTPLKNRSVRRAASSMIGISAALANPFTR